MQRGAMALVMVGALLAASTVAFAQVEQGTITGTVVDKSGGVVPGARVVATHVDTKVSRDTVSNASGNYTIPYLRAGTYEVSAELMGFTTARVEGVVVSVGSTASVNLTLAPAGLTENVTVTAAAPHLESQNATLANVVTGRQIQQLPMVGRNPVPLVVLAPGVQDRGNTGTGPIVNGARSNSTEVLLDGAEQRNSTTNDPQLHAAGGEHRGVQGRHERPGRRVRPHRRRCDHVGDQVRHEPVPRRRLRLHPPRQAQRQQLDEQAEQPAAERPAHRRIRLQLRRPDPQRPDVLLRQRGAHQEHQPRQPDPDRAHAAAAQRRLLRDPHQLGPAHHHLRPGHHPVEPLGRVRSGSLSRQCDSRRPHRHDLAAVAEVLSAAHQ